MARIYTDGAEFADTLFFDSVIGSASSTTTQYRSGGYSYVFAANGYGTKNFTATTEIYIRFGLRVTLNANDDVRVFYIRNGTTDIARISHNASTSKLQCYVGAASVGTTTASVGMNTWYLVEVHYLINDSTGKFELRIDGNTDLSYTGDTKPGADTTIDNFRVGSNVTGLNIYFDDIAVNDTSGSSDNSWCGEGKVILYTPDGNGDVTQLSGSDGDSTDNYLMVDDFPHDGDTTYVYQSGTGFYDLYNYTDCALSGVTIQRVWGEGRCRETSAAGGRIAFVVLPSGAMSVTESDSVALLTSYSRIACSGWKLNPHTSTEWTANDITGLQLGPITR